MLYEFHSLKDFDPIVGPTNILYASPHMQRGTHTRMQPIGMRE